MAFGSAGLLERLLCWGHAGYAWADTGGIYDTSQVPALRTPLNALDLEGIIGGGQIGYNWQRGAWVFGIEGDISGSDVSDDILSNETADTPDTIDADVNYLATARGRFGKTMGRTLVYATAGVFFTEIELQAVDTTPANGAGSGQISFEESGLVFGGGVSIQKNERVSVRVEYLRFDLDLSESLFKSPFTNNPDVDPQDSFSSDAIDVVRVGLNIKLGGAHHQLAAPSYK